MTVLPVYVLVTMNQTKSDSCILAWKKLTWICRMKRLLNPYIWLVQLVQSTERTFGNREAKLESWLDEPSIISTQFCFFTASLARYSYSSSLLIGHRSRASSNKTLTEASGEESENTLPTEKSFSRHSFYFTNVKNTNGHSCNIHANLFIIGYACSCFLSRFAFFRKLLRAATWFCHN